MTAAKGRRTRRRGLWPLYLMMAPGLLYLLINNVLPLFGLTMAFKDINFSQGLLQGVIQGDWAGLKHFRYLFQTKDAWIITPRWSLAGSIRLTKTHVSRNKTSSTGSASPRQRRLTPVLTSEE